MILLPSKNISVGGSIYIYKKLVTRLLLLLFIVTHDAHTREKIHILWFSLKMLSKSFFFLVGGGGRLCKKWDHGFHKNSSYQKLIKHTISKNRDNDKNEKQGEYIFDWERERKRE